ncbi:uncharacterized protein MAM_00528 [Metarhizium album ARSEF 1941]|uniref:Uncharacterized protein n=1 Tax=Metarhizium album (strain ARSEF 1941) TaxID=1081103 RepID=A0A0B2WZ00_METAS|nr:uncharacterized protein MAM_00528 [Metarhizium album ARSEF 1941]KHO01527.1 hypothetical protein MAM_00528 [Metarhizium album ARSEF 1941]
MLQSQEPTYGAASIPVQQSTEDNAATDENQPQRLYRSSLPASSESLPSQLSTQDQPRPSRSESNLRVTVESETKADEQNDHDDSSGDSNSAVGSKSSAHEREGEAEMLSLRDLSSSSTSSLAMTTGEVPALPAKSSLRASRLLASIPQKKAPNDDRPMLPHAAPHQIYLSSEEDASSSADDFSDFDETESDGGAASQRPSTRKAAREDTARVVSVVFHGKPSIVTLSPRRSMSPSSSEVGQAGAGLLRTSTEPSLQPQRPRSVSSDSSSTMAFHHPPRSSSMTTGFEKKRPHFLQIDPYAKVKDEALEHLRGPMTPTSMFRRTLSLVKKRSKPNLHQNESQLTPMEMVGEVEEDEDPRKSMCLESSTLSPVIPQDVTGKAQRHGSVSSPRSEASSPRSPKNRFRTGLSLGRQRSIKA